MEKKDGKHKFLTPFECKFLRLPFFTFECMHVLENHLIIPLNHPTLIKNCF